MGDFKIEEARNESSPDFEHRSCPTSVITDLIPNVYVIVNIRKRLNVQVIAEIHALASVAPWLKNYENL